MVIELSERNLSTRFYSVERKNEGPEEVILDEDRAFEILEGRTETEGVNMLSRAPASFRIPETGYSGTGYLQFGNPEGGEAELQTRSEEPREGPGRYMLSISVLPDYMDPSRVGRNPLR